MNIKSLLIGSAAALVAVSGARAADAIMAEPEPVEYVRVCDAYGAGFFYIPGTETCLKISGLAWLQITAGGDDDDDSTGSYHGVEDELLSSTNIRLQFDARSDTEWGTLRSFIRLQTGGPQSGAANNIGYNTVDGDALVDQAFIQLGGFTMGYTESLFGGFHPSSAPLSGYGSSSWNGLYYGYQQRDQISYVYSNNGLYAGIALEDDGGNGESYAPDVVGHLAYEQAWGGVFLNAGYDESAEGFGIKAGGQFNFGQGWVRVVGSYADSYNDYGVGHPASPFLQNNAEFTLLGELGYKVNEQLTVSVAGQYFEDVYVGGVGSDFDVDIDGWAAEFNLVYTPVTNFEVRTEIVYQDIDGGTLVGGPGFDPDGTVSGFLRFTRYF